MLKQYQHTQIGYLIIVLSVLVMLLLVGLMAIYGFNWGSLVVLIILPICLVLLASLTVAIENDFLKIRFGIGIIQRKFYLKDIVSSQIVKNPWYYGWGIRFTPSGLLYNVSGLYAVEIKLKNGKQYRIGTDVPNELEPAIRQSVGIKTI